MFCLSYSLCKRIDPFKLPSEVNHFFLLPLDRWGNSPSRSFFLHDNLDVTALELIHLIPIVSNLLVLDLVLHAEVLVLVLQRNQLPLYLHKAFCEFTDPLLVSVVLLLKYELVVVSFALSVCLLQAHVLAFDNFRF